MSHTTMRIVKALVPEGKLWNFLRDLKGLRRVHQPLPRKDERIVYITISESQDQKTLDTAINNLNPLNSL